MPDRTRIETARLVGQRITAADQDDMCRLHSDPEVMATLGGLRSDDETAAFVARFSAHWDEHGFGLWMFRDRESGAFRGRGGLQWTEAPGERCVEVGWAFLPEVWGQGLATEIGRASLDVAFDELCLATVWSVTMMTNRASRRVMEMLGLRYSHEGPYAGLDHVFQRIDRADRAGLVG